MFESLEETTQIILDVDSWDVSSVTSFDDIFQECSDVVIHEETEEAIDV